jgi:hypothetical protein
MNTKLIIFGALSVVAFITLLIINPFSWNDAGNRTVVERASGEIKVQFSPGMFYAGFWSKEKEWPNQISVAYQDSIANLELNDGTIEIGKVTIRFGSDATTANISGIVQYVLPSDEKDMIALHVAHRTPQSLVTKRLAPYTKECLQSSAQMMSSEMHYSGGRSTMSQDFGDQLRNGVFILKTYDKVIYDSLEKENKRVYETLIVKNSNGEAKRKVSSIKEYGITIADAAITDVDYESRVDNMLGKKIDAATKASVSKQELITAQQQALTSKAKGEQELVEIEYQQKQEQTKLVVAAQTKVLVAEQDKQQQKIALEGARLEALKIKEMASAEAFAKKAVMIADGALDKKIAAYIQVQEYWAKAFGSYTGNITPTYMMGGSYAPNGHNGAQNFMDLMSAKAMRDLNLDLTNSDK